MCDMRLFFLQIIAEASGKSKSALMLPHMEAKVVPPLNKRRLLPLRHVPQQTGYAASLTYAVQQDPPLIPLTHVRFLLKEPLPCPAASSLCSNMHMLLRQVKYFSLQVVRRRGGILLPEHSQIINVAWCILKGVQELFSQYLQAFYESHVYDLPSLLYPAIWLIATYKADVSAICAGDGGADQRCLPHL